MTGYAANLTLERSPEAENPRDAGMILFCLGKPLGKLHHNGPG